MKKKVLLLISTYFIANFLFLFGCSPYEEIDYFPEKFWVKIVITNESSHDIKPFFSQVPLRYYEANNKWYCVAKGSELFESYSDHDSWHQLSTNSNGIYEIGGFGDYPFYGYLIETWDFEDRDFDIREWGMLIGIGMPGKTNYLISFEESVANSVAYDYTNNTLIYGFNYVKIDYRLEEQPIIEQTKHQTDLYGGINNLEKHNVDYIITFSDSDITLDVRFLDNTSNGFYVNEPIYITNFVTNFPY